MSDIIIIIIITRVSINPRAVLVPGSALRQALDPGHKGLRASRSWWSFAPPLFGNPGSAPGNDSINSLIFIFISTVQEMFHWKLQQFKFHNYLLYVWSDLQVHHNFTVLFENVYSFHWINFKLGWISPLKVSENFSFLHHKSVHPHIPKLQVDFKV